MYIAGGDGLGVATSRWVQQDPAGYVDGTSLYQYQFSAPSGHTDAFGLQTTSATSQPVGGGFEITPEQMERARGLPGGVTDPEQYHPDPPGLLGEQARLGREWERLQRERKYWEEESEKALEKMDGPSMREADDKAAKARNDQKAVEKKLERVALDIAKEVMGTLGAWPTTAATAPASGPTSKPTEKR